MAAFSLLSLSGCLEDHSSNENTPTDDFDITDIELVNERSKPIEATVTATAGDETEFRETVTIEAGENEMFDDPLTDDTSYTITVTVDDDLRDRYDWSPETRDDAGIRVIIGGAEIKFEDIIA